MPPSPSGAVLVVAALLALAPACGSRGDPPEPVASASAAAAASASTSAVAAAAAPSASGEARGRAPLAPTTGEWLQSLHDAEGKLVAKFSPPLGATDPRPLVVALHGGGDAPEYACGEWRGSFGSWPFILCPYGDKVGRNMYGWRSGAAARQALEHAIEALVAKFPEHLDVRDPVLTGFSLGAMMAPSTLAAPGRAFPAAVLAEGYAKDFAAWPRRMEAGGLRRILFVDSQGVNAERGKAAVRALERTTAVQARAIYIGHLGHGFFPKTVEGVRKGLSELLTGLPGWERYPYPPIVPQ
ncbi:MAG TPA: hypothetical protein VFS00_18690 [Polyangiaceae bacterium]|nr:hypothetical protein [Polyangiaceae bacterium]